jgi:protein-S-isoprenylcysteine O-methyltransferase Ste14
MAGIPSVASKENEFPCPQKFRAMPRNGPSELESIESPPPRLSTLSDWITRRRIAISLLGFTALASINICLLKTHPQDLFHWTSLGGLVGVSAVLVGLGFRSWAAGTLRKSETLTQEGPYALVRNPLYVGSFLMMFGFCILLRDVPTMLFVCGPMVVVYWLQVKEEEKNLSEWFPNDWDSYVDAVPRFVPRLFAQHIQAGWSLAQWLKNREYQAVFATAIGLLAIIFWSWLWL